MSGLIRSQDVFAAGSKKSKRKFLVPGGGVEPPRAEARRILSPLRLPVPPSRLYLQVPDFTTCLYSVPFSSKMTNVQLCKKVCRFPRISTVRCHFAREALCRRFSG